MVVSRVVIEDLLALAMDLFARSLAYLGICLFYRWVDSLVECSLDEENRFLNCYRIVVSHGTAIVLGLVWEVLC